MERLAVKDAKDFSRDQFASNWVISAEETKIVRSLNTIVTDASIVDFKNV